MSQHGEGVTTRRKLCLSSAMFRESLSISRKPTLMRFPYWHLDLNAGCGWNEKADCEGTPLAFLREAVRMKRPSWLLCCDEKRPVIESLRGRLATAASSWDGGEVKWRAECCDNGDFLDAAGTFIAARENSRFAVGSVLSDPNGPSALPLDSLCRFAAHFPRIDVMLNVNASTWAMIEGCRRKSVLRPSDAALVAKYPRLADALARIGRRYWYVTNNNVGCVGAKMRFLVLVGRTIDLGKPPTPDFVRLDSPAGQDLVVGLRNVAVGQQYLF